MTEQIEQIYNGYYENYLALNPKCDNKWLKIEKIILDDRVESFYIEISVEDRTNHSTEILGKYTYGKWIFSSPLHQNMFWSYVKSHPNRFKKMFKTIRTNAPQKGIFELSYIWERYKRYLKFKFREVSQI